MWLDQKTETIISIAQNSIGDPLHSSVAYLFGNTKALIQVLDFKQAIEYLKLRLSIAKEVGDKVEERNAFGNLSDIYFLLSDVTKAIEYQKQILSIAKEVGDQAGEGRAYGNLGNAYGGLGDFKQAIEYNKLRLSIAKEVGDRAGEGRAYENLGDAYRGLGYAVSLTQCRLRGCIYLIGRYSM